MDTEISGLLKKKAAIRAPGGIWEWAWLLFTGVFGLLALIPGFSSRPPDLMPIALVVFALGLVGHYATKNSRLNLEVVERLMKLESRLERVEKGESGPPIPDNPTGRGTAELYLHELLARDGEEVAPAADEQ